MDLLIFQLRIIYLTESNNNEERERDKINSLNKQSKIESMQASTSVVCIHQMLTINAAVLMLVTTKFVNMKLIKSVNAVIFKRFDL